MDLKFQPSESPWPLSALAQNTKLVFSGVFTPERIKREQNRFTDRRLVKLILWGLRC